ncbi:MAG: hypothetical protein KJ970_16275 [Candidatus Eisenbacteria bacterium]|uniref:T9SS type A sorting domain-containing protein n=1 Tax=Eiseniibacteriota bacterium TaxID=2212470 RepID=A0A948RWT5_UNCEI|nr:hypothetical protein [Candidatus Eisenbacteria bacterium]MBU1948451.1 hypothetical protein [Candidatus Eisenbacteria bacterium]MBU2692478.1 hypothetical protein [Candidatus Eisenbacteria bacterium]
MSKYQSIILVLVLFLVSLPVAVAMAIVHEVQVANFAFSPADLTIADGDTVRWSWVSGTHTTTSGDPTSCTPDGLWNAPLSVSNTFFEFDFTGMGGTASTYFCMPHCLGGMRGSVTVQDVAGVSGHGGPGNFAGLSELHASPNPFNPDTVVRFILAQADHVQLRVFDATGRQIVLLADETMQPGSYNIPWDGRSAQGRKVPSGIYYISGKTSKGRSIAPMALIR